MELFFSLSGFLFFYTTQKKFKIKSLLKKKTIRLLIPFLLIGLFYLIPIRFIANYPPYESTSLIRIIYSFLTVNDCGHLWFLPTLLGIIYYSHRTYPYDEIETEHINMYRSNVIHFVTLSIFISINNKH